MLSLFGYYNGPDLELGLITGIDYTAVVAHGY